MILYIGKGGRLNIELHKLLDAQLFVVSDRSNFDLSFVPTHVIYAGRNIQRWEAFFRTLSARIPVLYLSTYVQSYVRDAYQEKKIREYEQLKTWHNKTSFLAVPFIQELLPVDVRNALSVTRNGNLEIVVTDLHSISNNIISWLGGNVSPLAVRQIPVEFGKIKSLGYITFWKLYSFVSKFRIPVLKLLVKVLEKFAAKLRIAPTISAVYLFQTDNKKTKDI